MQIDEGDFSFFFFPESECEGGSKVGFAFAFASFLLLLDGSPIEGSGRDWLDWLMCAFVPIVLTGEEEKMKMMVIKKKTPVRVELRWNEVGRW